MERFLPNDPWVPHGIRCRENPDNQKFLGAVTMLVLAGTADPINPSLYWLNFPCRPIPEVKLHRFKRIEVIIPKSMKKSFIRDAELLMDQRANTVDNMMDLLSDAKTLYSLLAQKEWPDLFHFLYPFVKFISSPLILKKPAFPVSLARFLDYCSLWTIFSNPKKIFSSFFHLALLF